MSHFSVSRTTVLRHINHLVKSNKVGKTGNTRQIYYYLVNDISKRIKLNFPEISDEFTIWKQHFSNKIATIANKNTYDICEYGFTEMLNNVIDHSNSQKVIIEFSLKNSNDINIKIIDDGLGAFATLAIALQTKDYKEIMLELSKGKVTRDKQNHTGEGFFFTSRAFDEFTLEANGLQYYKNNLLNDWTFSALDKKIKGTSVSMLINKNSSRKLIDVFNQYQNQETFDFEKTHVYVDLSKTGNETLISRSQAKRILRNIAGNFTELTLDFKKIRLVGQGFADEIFRVFQNKNKEIKINYINANEEVTFMIERSIKTE